MAASSSQRGCGAKPADVCDSQQVWPLVIVAAAAVAVNARAQL